MSWLSKVIGTASNVASFIPGVGPVASAALKGVSAIAGSITAEDQQQSEQNWSAHQAQLNRDFQHRERLESQAFNKEMWNLNNDYNSPVEQLKRAQAAGINPNSVIDGIRGGTAQPVTTSPMSGAMASSPGSIANSIMTNDAVVANLLAQTKNTEADTANKSYELTWNKLSEPERLENLRQNNRKLSADVDKITRDIQHIDFDENMQNRYYSWFSSKTEEEIRIMHEQLNLLRNQSLEVLSNVRKNDAQTALINEQTEGQDLSNQLQAIAVEFSTATGIPVGTPLHESAFGLWQAGKFEELNRLLLSYAVGESIHQDMPHRATVSSAYYTMYNRDRNAFAHDSFVNGVAQDFFDRPHLFRVPNRATERQRYWDSLPDMPRNVRVRLPSTR